MQICYEVNAFTCMHYIKYTYYRNEFHDRVLLFITNIYKKNYYFYIDCNICSLVHALSLILDLCMFHFYNLKYEVEKERKKRESERK